MLTGPIATLLVACALLARPDAQSAAEESSQARLRIETDVSLTTNLVHWVDNLAGTSIGKTMPVYRRHWEDRFGPFDTEDRRALEAFARIRRLPVATPGHGVANESGCLPVETEALGWSQLFLAEAMKARSVQDLRRALAPFLVEADLDHLVAALERFRPRFERVWKDLAHVRRFDARFRRFLAEGRLPHYLVSVAGFFGVDPREAPPMSISFVGLPTDGATHAEADGDHLLIEIRPSDAPEDQIQVVAHEASHFLMRMMTAVQVDRLAAQSFAEGETGALFWRYMWEGFPTALGQGLAEELLSPRRFSFSQRWYHLDSIDRFAKLIYPAVAGAVRGSRRIDEGVVPALTRSLRESSLPKEARAAEFLMTSFYASGEGMAGGLERLRARLGLGGGPASTAFRLDDPAASELLRRYGCLGGVALIGPAELERAAQMDGRPLLAPELMALARERAAGGMAVIAAGRRERGGPVYFLVAPGPEAVPPLIDAFVRLRGLPDRPILVKPDP